MCDHHVAYSSLRLARNFSVHCAVTTVYCRGGGDSQIFLYGSRSLCIVSFISVGRDAVERDGSNCIVSWPAPAVRFRDVVAGRELQYVPPVSVRSSVVRRLPGGPAAPRARVQQSPTLELRLRDDAAAARRSLRVDAVPRRRRR